RAPLGPRVAPLREMSHRPRPSPRSGLNGDQCVDGCTVTHGCAGALECCGGACPYVSTDILNCGACGMSGNGEMGGNNCCAGSCSNPLGDPGNCGACGIRCPGGCAMGSCIAVSNPNLLGESMDGATPDLYAPDAATTDQ